MISVTKLKSVDFYRKIPRDLTEASLSGAGMSIIAALSMMFLFGMELNNYLSPNLSTSFIVDRSPDGEFLRLSFDISFPSLSCEFAAVDVSDVLGTKRLNITKTIRKFPIDSNLKPIGAEFHPGPIPIVNNHGDEIEEDYGDDSISLTTESFEKYSHLHSVMVVNFYAPWCYWSNRLKPSWERAAKIIRERYDPEMDGRILMGKVDCSAEADLCKRHHIQGYPSIRIFRKGSDVKTIGSFIDDTFVSLQEKVVETHEDLTTLGEVDFPHDFDVQDNHGHHDHESYYGERDTESLVAAMETLVAPVPRESYMLAVEDRSNQAIDSAKRPAPLASGCRIDGYVRVKRVPGNLVFSARSGAHSFDASQINVSHVITHFAFGKRLSVMALTEMKRLMPHGGRGHERLSERSYITNQRDANANVTIEHYIQAVKIEIASRKSGEEHTLIEEYEYTAHSSLGHSRDIPVAKFHLDPSPMQVLITHVPKSFSHFLTNICAIIGGIFTVAGILDSVLHSTIRLVKKVELGKHF